MTQETESPKKRDRDGEFIKATTTVLTKLVVTWKPINCNRNCIQNEITA